MAVFFGIFQPFPGGWSIWASRAPTCRAPAEPGDGVAARYCRPQRRGAGDRHQDRIAVCRTRRIVDADEAIENCRRCFQRSTTEQTYNKLKSGAGFVWLQR
jgi:cell division protein FtsI (penicillin-binding protein 3)